MAAKKRAAKNKGKARLRRRSDGPRWPEPTDRYGAWAKNGAAVQRFEHAARALIAPGKTTSDQWTELERLGMSLVRHLEHCFGGGGGADWEALLRRALKAFPEPGLKRRRYCAARTISEWGQRWKGLVGNTPRAERPAMLRNCVHELVLHDKAFELLLDGETARSDGNLTKLSERLDAYHPRSSGKTGAMGAEQILAELIYDLADDVDGEILGFTVDPNVDPEDETDSIRKKLVRDVDAEKP